MLHNSYTVIILGKGMIHISATVRILADVPALKIGAGRQNDVCNFASPLKPYRLVDDAIQIGRTIHLRISVTVDHRPQNASPRTCSRAGPMHDRVQGMQTS